jgi:hypothetical protein
VPLDPESRGLKRLLALRQALAAQREVILGSQTSFVEYDASPCGELTAHVATEGDVIRLPSDIAADLVKAGHAAYPPGR